MVKTGPAGFTLIILDVISNYSSIPGKDEDGVPYAFGNIKDVSQNGKILNLSMISSIFIFFS